MKKIILAVTAICMWAMISCNPQERKDDPQPDPVQINKYDSVAVYRLEGDSNYILQYYYYYSYDEAGNTIEAIENSTKYNRVYDARKNMIEETEFMQHTDYRLGETEWVPYKKGVCTYNGKNQLVHEDIYDSYGSEWKLSSFEDWTYSDDGRSQTRSRGELKFVPWQDVPDTIWYRFQMTLDEHGNRLEEQLTKYINSKKQDYYYLGQFEYEYDQRGNITREHGTVWYNNELDYQGQIENVYTCDEAGNFLEKISKDHLIYYSSSGQISSERQTTYKYVYFY